MIIKKDTHSPIRFPKFIFGKTNLGYKIKFTESCRYNIGTEDQLDINKLYGIGYFPNHHINSVRFGWRYVADYDAIQIMAYWYVNKERKWDHICFITLEKEYTYLLTISDVHKLEVYDESSIVGNYEIKDVKQKNCGYLLGAYFGGNQKAPHDIKIEMEKL